MADEVSLIKAPRRYSLEQLTALTAGPLRAAGAERAVAFGSWARGTALDALLDAARELDLFYLPTRDPSGLDEGTPGQAFSAAHSGRAIELADRIVAATATAVR